MNLQHIYVYGPNIREINSLKIPQIFFEFLGIFRLWLYKFGYSMECPKVDLVHEVTNYAVLRLSHLLIFLIPLIFLTHYFCS